VEVSIKLEKPCSSMKFSFNLLLSIMIFNLIVPKDKYGRD